ncbi:transporter substrate-binding domain-containing protein [uncultured Tateyamaria sp.]|uniref:substrate-binding periplasmic protein n=1 Tax=uncultured Tateyamaria sp. TaxID=455651 RepID=UPI00262477CB|nr:transporter substrate-binding domain-containing protein [uncultured Tateyamaria sp.]
MRAYFLAAVAGLFLGTQAATAQTLNLAATEWPPFYGSELPDNGFMTEIVVEAFDRAGYGTDVSFLPWKRAFEGSRDGKYDALFTMWYREEREEFFIFSDPLPSNELVLLVRSGEGGSFEGYDKLKGKTVGVVRGYAAPPGFEEAGLDVSEARDDEENLRKLLRGRVDMALTDRIVAQHIINTKMENEAENFGWMEPPVHIDVQYMVVPKAIDGSAALMDAFNGSLAEMTSDGTLEKIMGKHGF